MTEYLDRYPTMHEYAEGKRINPKLIDLISRADAIEEISKGVWNVHELIDRIKALPSADAVHIETYRELYEKYVKLKHASAEAVQGWIPCSERLPEDIRPVLVTWKNTDPASYYQYIVGKHFIGTAHYCKGKWYWYSSVTEDLLAEYGKCESEEFDDGDCIRHTDDTLGYAIQTNADDFCSMGERREP